ncbi:MAG: hypothetical protein WCR04_03880 [Fibrobacteraceae bacterium]
MGPHPIVSEPELVQRKMDPLRMEDYPVSHPFERPEEPLDPSVLLGAVNLRLPVPYPQDPETEPEQFGCEHALVVRADDFRLAVCLNCLNQRLQQRDRSLVRDALQRDASSCPVVDDAEDARSRCCCEVPVENVRDLPHPGGGHVRLDAYDLPPDPCRLWLPVAAENVRLPRSSENAFVSQTGMVPKGHERQQKNYQSAAQINAVRSGWHKNISRSRPERKNIISGSFCFLLRPLEFFQNFVESRALSTEGGKDTIFFPVRGNFSTSEILGMAALPRRVRYAEGGAYAPVRSTDRRVARSSPTRRRYFVRSHRPAGARPAIAYAGSYTYGGDPVNDVNLEFLKTAGSWI